VYHGQQEFWHGEDPQQACTGDWQQQAVQAGGQAVNLSGPFGSYTQQQQQQQQYPDVYHGQASQANPASGVAFVPSPRTPGFRRSFQQPPAAMWGSQIRTQLAADAGLIPRSTGEGMRVTHGRPPCALLAWGFGGRIAVMRPLPQGQSVLLTSPAGRRGWRLFGTDNNTYRDALSGMMFAAGAVTTDTQWQLGALQRLSMSSVVGMLTSQQPSLRAQVHFHFTPCCGLFDLLVCCLPEEMIICKHGGCCCLQASPCVQDDSLALLEQFPGPLTPSVARSKVSAHPVLMPRISAISQGTIHSLSTFIICPCPQSFDIRMKMTQNEMKVKA
jgi:hypothetical protein